MDRRDPRRLRQVDLGHGEPEHAVPDHVDHGEPRVKLTEQMRDTAIGLQPPQPEHPFPVHRGIKQRREPQQPGQPGIARDDPFQPIVPRQRDPYRVSVATS